MQIAPKGLHAMQVLTAVELCARVFVPQYYLVLMNSAWRLVVLLLS